MNIWILAEDIPGLAALRTAAAALDAQAAVTAFVKGSEDEAQKALAFGATAAFALPQPTDGALWEGYAPALADKAKAEQPRCILVAATRRGRDLAAQLAALLDAPCFSDAQNLRLDNNGLTAETLLYGGIAVKSAGTDAPLVLATLSAGAYEAAPASQATNISGGEVATLPYPAQSDPSARITGRTPRPAQSANLEDAERVVGCGRGFAEESELNAARELASALGAEIACSRPLAEFLKWLPEERYIGISGQQLKPKLYLAVGISGQAQHLYGVRGAKVIVSINKDAECLMHQNADYYINGTWQDVLPALLAAVRHA